MHHLLFIFTLIRLVLIQGPAREATHGGLEQGSRPPSMKQGASSLRRLRYWSI